jgi:CRP-like cAMP-binding protein
MVKRRPKHAPTQAPDTFRNRLLAALPQQDRLRLVPHLDNLPLKTREVLHQPDRAIEHVYFPGGGFCSIVTVLRDGSMVEVATVGREGMVGIAAALDVGRATPPAATIVQGATETCYRMAAGVFRREMDRRGAFYEVITSYTQAYVGFIMQSTACNAKHSVEQRLARWLLMAHDRMGTDSFPLTQEFVAMMLGAARPTVTIVARSLQDARLIRYRRGLLTIVDRAGLETAACECYRTTTNLFRAIPASREEAAAQD